MTRLTLAATGLLTFLSGCLLVGDVAFAKDGATLFDASNKSLPPAQYKGIKPGTSYADAVKALPNLAKSTVMGVRDYENVSFFLNWTDDKSAIERIWVSLPPTGADWLNAGWGPGVSSHGEFESADSLRWWSPENHVRATLQPLLTTSRTLNYTTYVPFEEFLGVDGPTFAFLKGNALVGQKVEEIGAAFGNELFASYPGPDGKKIKKRWNEITDAKPTAVKGNSFYLQLAPTDYDDYWTRVNLDFPDDGGACYGYDFGMEYKGDTGGHDRLVGILEKKFGKGKAIEVYGKPMVQVSDKPKMTYGKGLGSTVEFKVDARPPRK